MIVLIFLLAATPAGTAWGARSIFQFYGFRQLLETSYTFDSIYNKINGQEGERARHATQEAYLVDLDYAVLTPRIWRGTLSLGLEGQQDFQREEDGGNRRQIRYNYDLTGIVFRLQPHPVSFNIGSNTQRVTPAFSRSYQMETDQRGITLSMKSFFLPATISYDHFVFQTSGQVEDYRDSMGSFGVTLGHVTRDRFSSTTASLRNNHGISEILSSGARQDHYSVSANINNLLQPFPGSGLTRTLNSSYTWHGDDGSNKGKAAVLKEALDWDLGRELKLRLEGELDASTSGAQKRDRKEAKGELQHRLLDTVTTRVVGKQAELELDTGTEKSTGGGIGVGYNRRLPEQSNFSLDYFFNHQVTDSQTGTEAVFYRDERLNAGPVETDNYLSRTDVVASTLVVWNASRTKTYLQGLDYTPIQDGRRTRLRIEPGGAINFGDAISIDYDVRVNPQLKFETDTHAISSVLNLWRVYNISASYSQSEERKISGRDDVAPLGPQRFLGARVERLDPLYRAGIEYATVSSSANNYRKLVGYWRYNEEFEKSAVSANVSDTLQQHEEIVSGGVVSSGGTSNRFMASALYRRQLNESLNVVLSGEFESASGRSTDQQLVATWFKGSYKGRSIEVDLNMKVDWRFYDEQYQSNFTTRVDLKRYF